MDGTSIVLDGYRRRWPTPQRQRASIPPRCPPGARLSATLEVKHSAGHERCNGRRTRGASARGTPPRLIDFDASSCPLWSRPSR